jgi:hypothetical protein
MNDGKAAGGYSRAARLTAEKRSLIARRAAVKRWSEDDLPSAVCGSPDRPLRIGDVALQCYVLEDGIRVLSQGGFLEAMGRHPRPRTRTEGADDEVPAMVRGVALAPFVTDEIIEKGKPIAFQTPAGNRALGYRAELLPLICEVYLKARDANKLPSNQKHVAQRADILIRGLAHTGIIALVDEATGYQELRSKNDLARILEAFIAKELQPWVQTFPDDFYREIFRLRQLEYPRDSVKRPQYFGHLTNDIVYRRLAPGVLEELKTVTPRSETGVRKHKYFQRLTSNMGYPKLREHLGSVVTLMKLSRDWPDFESKLDQIHPRYGETLPLPLDYDEPDTGIGL